MTATSGAPTTSIGCRLGERNPSVLETDEDDDGVVSSPRHPGAASSGCLVTNSRCLSSDRRSTSRSPSGSPRSFQPLGDPGGWGVRFGRELNATDDRHAFRTAGGGLPVVEGKHIEPFRVDRVGDALAHRRTRCRSAAWHAASSAAAGVPRRGELDESSHAHRRAPAPAHRLDAHRLLPAHAAAAPAPALSVRSLQQLRAELPGAPASHDARHDRDRGAVAGAPSGRGAPGLPRDRPDRPAPGAAAVVCRWPRAYRRAWPGSTS